MIRYGLGILVAASSLALMACEEEADPGASGTGGATGAGGNAGATGATECTKASPPSYGAPATVPGTCTGACCPASASCYSTSATPVTSAPGAECVATQDNTGKTHIQMRQQWIRAITPVGNTVPLVYGVLSGRTQLPWAMCNQTGALGSGGYIQIIDFFLGGTDKSKHYSTVGYTKFVPGPATPGDKTFTPTDVLTNGFCFGTQTQMGGPAANGQDYGLTADEVGKGENYPPGLPKPMFLKGNPTGWAVGPTKAKRLDVDFDVCTDRVALLAKLDPAGEYGTQGFGGVFYFDDATGSSHGFGRMGWVVVYDGTGATHITIPIREVETRSKFNNKDAPNCVGTYLASAIDPATCQAGTDPLKPAWGGGDCGATLGKAACGAGESAASTTGYFLISELQQIYANDLQNTLCVTYPGVDPATSTPKVAAEGFFDTATSSCKTSKWNPNDPVNGLPKGDWCAATNSPASDSCHDAWQSKSFHVYAGAKIAVDATDTPATCAF